MEGTIIGFALVTLLMLIGVPVAMAFGFLAFFLATWFHADPSYLLPVTFVKISSVIILSGPLYIMLGGIIHLSGLASKLIDVVMAVLGRFRGSLGAVTVVALAVFGSVTGADSAGIACVGTILIPKMVEGGYPRGHSTALVACAGVLGQLIPPSVPMIFYALLTGQSIPFVWLATVGPAMLIITVYIIMNYFMSRRFPLLVPPKLAFKDQAKTAGLALYRGIPFFILPIIILGGVYGGITTPTEAAVVGVAYIFFLLAVLRNVSLKNLGRTIYKSGATAGVIIIMLFFILITSRILVVETIPQRMANWVVAVGRNQAVVLLMVNIIMLIMGMLMDDLSGTLLSATMLFPIVQAVGVDPIHFAAIVGVNLGLGTVTPPCAPMLYLAGRIGNCPAKEYMKPALILMFVGMLPVLIITTYWPWLSLVFPRLAGYLH